MAPLPSGGTTTATESDTLSDETGPTDLDRSSQESEREQVLPLLEEGSPAKENRPNFSQQSAASSSPRKAKLARASSILEELFAELWEEPRKEVLFDTPKAKAKRYSPLNALCADAHPLRLSPVALSPPVPEAACRSSLYNSLCALAGLRDRSKRGLVPLSQPFRRLATAIAKRSELLAAGTYEPWQLGVYAQDVTSQGAKQWLVATHPGFAIAASPKPPKRQGRPQPEQSRHFYEVFLEDRPCWLYFDLEYSRKANPDIQPKDLAAAFLGTLSDFCTDALGAPLDFNSVYSLDSTTPEKFSQHVVAKRLLPGACCKPQNLAFKNNAQAGFLVEKFLEYVEAQRQNGGLAGARAELLFLRPPKAAAGEAGAEEEVSVVDRAVYTRNRCFRVLFSSKLGKQRTLLPCWGKPGDPPARQLLDSLASFVPEGTATLESNGLIPEDYGHTSKQRRRSVKPIDPSSGMPRNPSSSSACPPRPELDGPLFAHLARTWDDVRRQHEPSAPAAGETGVQSMIEIDDRYWAVNLKRNRFCFCKGASHKSNGVYMVVDLERGVFYQKCHDVDCRNFRSEEYPVPEGLLPRRTPQQGQEAPGEPDARPDVPAPATPLGKRGRSSEDCLSPQSTLGPFRHSAAEGEPLAKRSRSPEPGRAAARAALARGYSCFFED